MKALTLITVSALAATLSFSVLAEPKTTIKKSIVLNQSINKGNATVAYGEDNLASTGSVNLKNAKVKKSIVVNQSVNKYNATIAEGKHNAATTGSLTVE